MKKFIYMIFMITPIFGISQGDEVSLNAVNLSPEESGSQPLCSYIKWVEVDSIMVERVSLYVTSEIPPWEIFSSITLEVSDTTISHNSSYLADEGNWSFSSNLNAYRIRFQGIAEILYLDESMAGEFRCTINENISLIPTLTLRVNIRTTDYLGITQTWDSNTAQSIFMSTAQLPETTVSEMVMLYPNPTVDTFRLEGNNIYSIEIFNNNGLLVKSFSQVAATYSVADIPHGTYFVRIESKNGTTIRRIIKK